MLFGKTTFGLFCALLCFDLAGQIVINEISSKNETILIDYEGESSDWIELYNSNSDTSINLEGFYLSDDAENLHKWTFPNVFIEGDSHLIVFASGEDTLIDNEIHTNFSIKSEGESLFLSNSLGTLIDTISAKALLEDESYGRSSDGNISWLTFTQPTPNESNEQGLLKYEITFSHSPGHYLEDISLEMESNDGFSIYYTTDGSLPNTESNLYTYSLLLSTREGEADVFSIIKCTDEPYVPLQESKKSNIIRAQIFEGDQALSKVYTQTYLIDPDSNRYTLPIISLVSQGDNFFDSETGICKKWWKKGSDWERDVHLEYFDEGALEFSQDCGIRIHGGSSSGARQKPFKLYARSEYGNSTFDYPFFEDKDIEQFKRLILRTPRSHNGTYFTDELVSSIIQDTELERQAQRQVVVFLNGEYWGFYHLREKIDEFFIEENTGIDRDSCIIISNDPILEYNCEVNDCEEYLPLWEIYHGIESINDSTYNLIANQLDIPNFRQYYITQFFVGNTDWPFNNVRRWKPVGQGKWRQIYFDSDFSMSSVTNVSLPYYINQGNFESWAFQPGLQLLQYEPFLEEFLADFEIQLNSTFKQEILLPKINQLKEVIAPEIGEYFSRFALDATEETWEAGVEEVKYFIAHRPCVIQEQIEELFDVTIEIDSCYQINEEIVEEIDTSIYEPEFTHLPYEGQIFLDIPPKNQIDSLPIGNIAYRRDGLWIEQQQLPISCLDNSLEVETPIQLIIYNPSGQVIQTDKLMCSEINSGVNYSYLDYYPPGLYLFQVIWGSEVQSFKVLKTNH